LPGRAGPPRTSGMTDGWRAAGWWAVHSPAVGVPPPAGPRRAPTGDPMTSADRQVSPPAATGGLRPPVAAARLGSWWVLAAATLLMLGVLGWRFVADPSLAAPTRDPAWYTWRANVVMEDDPASVVREWGPGGRFSGGYRVTVPVEGALLQRVVGIDTYSMAKFLMLGVPILT